MPQRSVPSVLWREGMFLSTQHFQALSRETLDAAAWSGRITRTSPHGLVSLSLDESKLADSVFDVRGLEAVFPDGTHARIPGNAEISAAGFADEFKGPELQVWIGLPEVRENHPLIDSGREERARFRVQSIGTYDENLRDAVQSVDFRMLRIKVFFGDDPPPGFDALPVARLVREGRPVAVPVLSPKYVPPLMECGGSPVLMRRMAELAMETRRRVRDLAERVPSVARLSDVGRGIDFASLLQLQALNRTCALLEQLCRSAHLPPHHAYLELVRMCADLSLFHKDRAVAQLPSFEHLRTDRCFQTVLANLNALIELEVEHPYECVPFERDALISYFNEIRIPAEWLERRAAVYLGVQLARPAEEVAVLIPDAIKLFAPSERDHMLEGIVPGIALSFERMAPLAFPKRDDLHYFRIDTDGDSRDSWTLVEREKSAMILNALDDLAEARFEFYVEKPRRHG